MKIMRKLAAILFVCGFMWITTEGKAADSQEVPEITAARKSRDSSDVEGLRKAIKSAHDQAQQKNTAQAYEQVVVFDDWLCEVGHAKNDDSLIKAAATDGLAAAEKAASLNSNSSEAHRLQGEMLSELITVTFAGGMRYGARSSGEFDKAIELDPRNANAYIGRALSYFFTPSMFGGDRNKAVEMLKKAVTVDPASDTAHIWLAHIYLDASQTADARREINEARRINPGRGFTNSVDDQVKAQEKKLARK